MRSHFLAAFSVALVSLFPAPASLSASAPKLSQEQVRLLTQVLSSDSEVTKEIHTHFWAPLKTSHDTEALRTIAELAQRRDILLLVQRYQREVWACALESWVKNSVIRTAELEAIEAEALEVAQESPGSETSYRASLANTQRLLDAAARHGTVTTPRGELEISAEFIVGTLEAIDAAISRATILLNPTWRNE